MAILMAVLDVGLPVRRASQRMSDVNGFVLPTGL